MSDLLETRIAPIGLPGMIEDTAIYALRRLWKMAPYGLREIPI